MDPAGLNPSKAIHLCLSQIFITELWILSMYLVIVSLIELTMGLSQIV